MGMVSSVVVDEKWHCYVTVSHVGFRLVLCGDGRRTFEWGGEFGAIAARKMQQAMLVE